MRTIKPIYLLFSFLILIFTACLKGKFSSPLTIKPGQVDSAFTNYFKKQSGVTAAIGARSLTLSDGRMLWLFGKSHLNDFNTSTQKISCNANAHNAAMLFAGNTISTLNNGNADFIPSNEVNTWFTPLHAYQYFDTVFLFAKKEGSSIQNNKTYIAKFQFPSLQFLSIDSMSLSNTIYGYNILVDTAIGFCYIYGLKNLNPAGQNSVCLARFPMNNPYSTWMFYATDQWINYAQNAIPITQIPAENFSIRKIRNQFVMITQDAAFMCNEGTNIYSNIASYPYGPFLNYTKIYTIQDKIGSVTSATKQPTIHPEFTSNDELLVTYSIDGFDPCQTTCNNNEDEPDYHRIKAIRVPLKSINPSM